LSCSRVSCHASLRRHFGTGTPPQMPEFLKPVFQYASDAYITQGIQAGMEVIHSLDVPWAASFVLSGLALRLLTAPAHVLADRLYAKRLHLSNYLSKQMFMKVAERHKIPIVIDPKTQEAKFGHSDEKLNAKAHVMVNSALNSYFKTQRLQKPRIMLLKVSTIPIWIFSSVAIRNILTADFGIGINNKFLWIDNIVEADPYFVLPIAVGLCGFLNLYSQRIVFPAHMQQKNLRIYDGILAFTLILGVAILTKMPACISLYWLTVSMTGIAQSVLLRHPKVKEIFKIQRLPWDSKTPVRDLFFLRKRQLS